MLYRLLLLIFIVMVPSFSSATSLRPPSKAERFVHIKAEHLSEHVSKPAWKKIQALILEQNCPKEGAVTGARSRKPSSKVVVVTVECSLPQELINSDPNRYFLSTQYPLTIIVLRDRVTKVDFEGYEFMYQSGHISFITDIDGNNNPEFWLTGSICECDGQPEDYGPEGCDCDGGVTLEFKNGGFQQWKKGRGWNAR